VAEYLEPDVVVVAAPPEQVQGDRARRVQQL
jgi:hypothetical protein